MLNSFWNHAQADGDRLALVEPDGTEYTAAALLAACNQVAHGLRALGLSKGDTVAVMMPNSAAVVQVALAAAQTGLYITPINWHLVAPEVAFILEDCDAKAVVCGEQNAAVVRAALGDRDIPSFVVGEAEGFRPFPELKAGQPTTLPRDRFGGFTMTYTSGTTGRPRGVRRPTGDVPPEHLAESFTGFLRLFGIEPKGVHLVVAPLYHTAVINFTLYSLHFGHTVVLMDKWTAEGTLQRIDRYRVTTTHIVPTQLSRMVALPDDVRANYDVSSMEHMIHGAAPCPDAVKRRMLEWFGPVVYEYYAASEGGGTIATPEQWLAKPGTVGLPWPISQIRIFDDDKQPVPTGEVGTVWIRMGEHKFEYHGDEDKTRDAWSEGFFTVGDAGYLDEDGFLFLCDRKADMIISGGVNIYPAEVENVLHEHEGIADCAVFGIPDDDWGEQVKAVVQLEPGYALAEATLLAWCKEHIAGYKCPRSVDFLPALPRDPNGKLYKRRLRDPYWEGRERQI